MSICDHCNQEIEADKAQTCEDCGGVFCESHIGVIDHGCGDIEEDWDDDGDDESENESES